MRKLKTFSLILFLISLSICAFACTKSPTMLSTPSAIDYVIIENEDTNENKIILVTDFNPNASKYEFFISDSDSEEKTYVSYLSDNNILDVTNIFADKKNYSFYVKYIGSGKFLNSKNSKIKTYVPNQEQVKTPTLQLNETELEWFKIVYATGYEVYETVLDKNNEQILERTKIASLNSSTYSYNIECRTIVEDAPYKKFQYEVKAVSSGFYNNSELSNAVTFVKDITLKNPSNLNLTKLGNDFTLSWSEVEYATKYEVVINENTKIECETNEVNLNDYITNYGDYTFKVKAKESDALSYSSSDYSEVYSYTYSTKLNAPENLNVSINGEYLLINFNEVKQALSYSIELYCGNEKVYEDNNLTQTDVAINVASLNSANNEIKIKVKANAVGFYIHESDYSELNYTINS